MDNCDAPIRSKGLCERHYRRPSDDRHHKQKSLCQVCGIAVFDGATLCRAHYLAAKKPKNLCACGAELSTRKAVKCRDCWMRDHMAKTSRPTCTVCGKPISWAIGRRDAAGKRLVPERCRDCEKDRRRANRVVVLREGMTRDLADDLDVSRWIRLSRGDATPFRKLIGDWPCAVCGYDEDRCEIDRIVPDLGYVYGNVAQVCGNCHNKITRGKIPHPPPTVIPALEEDV